VGDIGERAKNTALDLDIPGEPASIPGPVF
jgi:hypothetical protein